MNHSTDTYKFEQLNQIDITHAHTAMWHTIQLQQSYVYNVYQLNINAYDYVK